MKITEVSVAMAGACHHEQDAFRQSVGLTNSLEDEGDLHQFVRRCQTECLRHLEKFGFPDADKVIDNESGE